MGANTSRPGTYASYAANQAGVARMSGVHAGGAATSSRALARASSRASNAAAAADAAAARQGQAAGAADGEAEGDGRRQSGQLAEPDARLDGQRRRQRKRLRVASVLRALDRPASSQGQSQPQAQVHDQSQSEGDAERQQRMRMTVHGPSAENQSTERHAPSQPASARSSMTLAPLPVLPVGRAPVDSAAGRPNLTGLIASTTDAPYTTLASRRAAVRCIVIDGNQSGLARMSGVHSHSTHSRRASSRPASSSSFSLSAPASPSSAGRTPWSSARLGRLRARGRPRSSRTVTATATATAAPATLDVPPTGHNVRRNSTARTLAAPHDGPAPGPSLRDAAMDAPWASAPQPADFNGASGSGGGPRRYPRPHSRWSSAARIAALFRHAPPAPAHTPRRQGSRERGTHAHAHLAPRAERIRDQPEHAVAAV